MTQLSLSPEPCTYLEWDSVWWGLRTARVQIEIADETSLALIDAWCAKYNIEFLYYLCPSSNMHSAHLAEGGGYRMMDIRVRLSVRLSGLHTRPPRYNQIEVRPHVGTDIARLRALAESSYHETRFFADHRLPRDRCRGLYGKWIERDSELDGGVILVAIHEGDLAGYITCGITTRLNKASIGLLAVDPLYKGKGIGSALIDRAIRWCIERGVEDLDVVTQASNISAQRLYGRSGFLVSDVDIWFHKWYR